MSHLEASKLFNVNGLVAVITGGGSGIGLMVAKALDANGAKAVYIVGRRKNVLDDAAKQAINGSIKPIVGDVTSKESLTAVANQIEKEVGYINVLFANSGVIGLDIYKKLGQDYSLKQFKEVMWEPEVDSFSKALEVNISGVFYTALAFLELLDAGNQKGNVTQKSQIVITNSVASYSRYPAAGFDYSASKAGVVHLMKNLATVLTRFTIRVNAIAPGIYPSDMTLSNPALSGSGGGIGISKSQIPLGRMGTEEDMAGAALFLMGPAGAYISGNVLLTDGGRVSVLPSSY